MRLGHSVAVRSPWAAPAGHGYEPGTGYILSFALLAAVIALRWVLDPLLGDALPFVTLFGAVAASTWLGGLGAAAGVTLVGYLAVAYFFIAPRGAVSLSDTADVRESAWGHETLAELFGSLRPPGRGSAAADSPT